MQPNTSCRIVKKEYSKRPKFFHIYIDKKAPSKMN